LEADTSNVSDLGDAWSKQKVVKPSGIKPTIAGVVLIINGLMAIPFGIIFIINGINFIETSGMVLVMGAMAIFNGLASFVGGICAVNKTNSKYVMWGAVFSLFTFVIPGIIVLFLLWSSADEFES
jgi:hypothetical protein